MLESNSSVTVQVGSLNLGIFAYKSGGQVEAEDTKFRPGAMQPQVSLGGPIGVENVTVRKLYDASARGVVKQLRAMCGKAEMTVTYQPLDADGNPSGAPDVYRGKLMRVTTPDADSNSNDAAQLELECSTHGAVA